jgi:hypothetical protein
MSDTWKTQTLTLKNRRQTSARMRRGSTRTPGVQHLHILVETNKQLLNLHKHGLEEHISHYCKNVSCLVSTLLRTIHSY